MNTTPYKNYNLHKNSHAYELLCKMNAQTDPKQKQLVKAQLDTHLRIIDQNYLAMQQRY